MRELLNQLMEMAYHRKAVEQIVYSQVDTVLLHLIKLLRWRDDFNVMKYKKEINAALYRVQRPDLKKSMKKFNADVYYRILWHEPVGEDGIDKLKSIIRRELKEYHSLPVVRDEEEVLRILDSVYRKVSVALSKDDFEDIDDYL